MQERTDSKEPWINRFCHVKPHLAANTLPQFHLSKSLRYKYLGITISTEEMQTIVTSISSELKMWHNQQRNKCKRIENKSRERRIKNYLQMFTTSLPEGDTRLGKIV